MDGFDRVGASLYIDQAQLAKYFELAERVLSERVLAPQAEAARAGAGFREGHEVGALERATASSRKSTLDEFGNLHAS